jgi:hypothetical protein
MLRWSLALVGARRIFQSKGSYEAGDTDSLLYLRGIPRYKPRTDRIHTLVSLIRLANATCFLFLPHRFSLSLLLLCFGAADYAGTAKSRLMLSD